MLEDATVFVVVQTKGRYQHVVDRGTGGAAGHCETNSCGGARVGGNREVWEGLKVICRFSS